MTIGQMLQVVRERKDLTMHRVAGLSELSISVVHGAENGKDIAATTLRKIVTGGLAMRMSKFWRELEDEEDRLGCAGQATSERGTRKARKVAA